MITTTDTADTTKKRTVPFVVVSVVSVVVTAALFAQQSDRARTEALAARAGERLQALQREADRLAAEERTVLGDLQKLEIDRQLKAAELKQIDADAAGVAADLDALNARVASLQSAEASARPELRARLVELYKLGEARYMRVLLSTPDLRRIGDATRMVAALAKLDRDRVTAHAQTLAQLASTRKTLEARSHQVEGLRADAAKAQTALDRAAAARNALVRDIDKQRDLNAQLSGELQSAQQKLQAALRDMNATPANAEPGTRNPSNPEPATLNPLPLRPFKGDLDWPVAGTVRSRFGRGSRANGVTIETADGADTRAVHDGVVAFAGPFGGFGNLVIIDHGAQAFSLYGDLLELAVKKGARIDRGQVVGTTGATPLGAPGLYFELRVDGQPVDPLQWLRKR
jgi:septal ring factor EnvC (AmiA/AmiB activator)